jgi:hypothetical protein
MRRREFIMLVRAAVAWPLAARTQQPERMRRIGVLMSFADPTARSYVTAFRGALTKLGWARTEVRWGNGDADKFRALAKQLVDLQPDAIVGHKHSRGCRSRSRDTDHSYRIRKCSRPNRQRVCRKSRAPGQQFDRFHDRQHCT